MCVYFMLWGLPQIPTSVLLLHLDGDFRSPDPLQTMGALLQVSCGSIACYCMLLRVSVVCHYRSNEVNY